MKRMTGLWRSCLTALLLWCAWPALAAELELSEEDAADYLTPYQAAERGLVDSVITPAATRGSLIEGLRLLDRKIVPTLPKKHGNIVL